MAELYVGNEFGEVWRDLLGDIIDVGKRSSPRGSETKELLNVSIEVQSAQANILVNNSRDLNYRFMIAEWLWIQAGLNDVDILAQYISQMRKFSDDGPHSHWGIWTETHAADPIRFRVAIKARLSSSCGYDLDTIPH